MTEFEQMQVEQLKRIADVLEDINSAIIDMGASIENLSDCVGYVPPQKGYVQTDEYKFLRIGGGVDVG